MVEYLLSRRRINRAPAEKHGVLHVLSYQRRLHHIKTHFFSREVKTPLGKLVDWWDRIVFYMDAHRLALKPFMSLRTAGASNKKHTLGPKRSRGARCIRISYVGMRNEI